MVDSISNNPSLPHLQDKLLFLRESIDEVVSRHKSREKQKLDFIEDIDQKLCEVQSSIYHLEQFGYAHLHGHRRTNLEQQIKELEREKRNQELECWRDLSALQKELCQLKKEYRAVRAGVSCIQQKTS